MLAPKPCSLTCALIKGFMQLFIGRAEGFAHTLHRHPSPSEALAVIRFIAGTGAHMLATQRSSCTLPTQTHMRALTWAHTGTQACMRAHTKAHMHAPMPAMGPAPRCLPPPSSLLPPSPSDPAGPPEVYPLPPAPPPPPSRLLLPPPPSGPPPAGEEAGEDGEEEAEER